MEAWIKLKFWESFCVIFGQLIDVVLSDKLDGQLWKNSNQ